jgi:hypothetical protein
MTIADKDRNFQELRDAAVEQRWRVERRSKNNYMFYSPDGKTSVTAGGNYKGPHSLKNLVAQLRKGGFVPPEKMRR